MVMLRKKLFYVPGLISLVVLPIILLVFPVEDPPRKVVLKMYLPSDDEDRGAGLIRYSKYSINEMTKGKRIVSIYLSDKRIYYGDFRDGEFEAKLNFVAREMERLQFTNDTNSVLRVVFDEGCEYSDFIEVLNRGIIYQFKRYAWVKDSFYFFPNPPPVYYPPMILEVQPPVYIPGLNYKRPTTWDLFKLRMENSINEWVYYLEPNYVLAIGFILLILLPALFTLRKNRRNYPIRVSYT